MPGIEKKRHNADIASKELEEESQQSLSNGEKAQLLSSLTSRSMMEEEPKHGNMVLGKAAESQAKSEMNAALAPKCTAGPWGPETSKLSPKWATLGSPLRSKSRAQKTLG